MNLKIIICLCLLTLINIGCDKNKGLSKKQKLEKIANEKEFIPVLSPQKSMKKMKLADKGLEIKLVASEPMISNPVDMAFDNKGRLWVVEMRGWIPLPKYTKGKVPLGKIVILADTNNDGKMDTSKVFLDSLKAPRAIYIDNKGILFATPPNLWYVYRDNDKPGKKILVDSTYTVTDNDEGQTNGLLYSFDNWIYSAGFGSRKKYQKIGGKWKTEETMIRGQWGLTQDKYGHLFYNHNMSQLMGDYFMPGLIKRNENHRKASGFNEVIVKDQRVYPLMATPGANNAYRPGELNDSTLKLERFTAASGPVIYKGALLGEKYAGNAFVNEPVAHLIKRDIISYKGNKIVGHQAYKGKEFLASTDKRFRPVTVKNGPDGALYVIDMYRGVIEDSVWVTPHLRKYALNHGLNKGRDKGRIYKIIPKDSNPQMVTIPDNITKLVNLLGNKNGWVRIHAQKRLVVGNYKSAVPILKNIITANDGDKEKIIHTLWTLEGLNALTVEEVVYLINNYGYIIQKQAINALSEILNKSNYKKFIGTLDKLLNDNSKNLIAVNIAYLIDRYLDINQKTGLKYLKKIVNLYPKNKFVASALINGIVGDESKYLAVISDTNKVFNKRLSKIVALKKEKKNNVNLAKRRYHNGFLKFSQLCQNCHGANGEGIKSLGAPLNRSEFVTGNKNRVISIILNGLTGPIKINGKVYKKPLVSGTMPSFRKILSDKEIQSIINYIRHAWDNNASSVSTNDVSIIRYNTRNRDKPYTGKEIKRKFK